VLKRHGIEVPSKTSLTIEDMAGDMAGVDAVLSDLNEAYISHGGTQKY
jgi:hypothetical protein